jgi:hypothetical protein
VPRLFSLVFFLPWFLQCKRRHFHGSFQSCTNSASEGDLTRKLHEKYRTGHYVSGCLLYWSSGRCGQWGRKNWVKLPTRSIHAAISLKQQTNKQTNSMVWVRERTIPTERPPFVGEVIANFCG